MPAPIALDILLGPGRRLAAAARALNAALVADGHDAIVLGPRAVPHLTLLQICVSPDRVAALSDSLRRDRLADRAAGLPLTATGLGTAPFAGGQAISILAEATPALRGLHDRVCALAAPFATPGTAASFLHAPGERDIHPDAVSYAVGFLAHHAGAAWVPHVTVGFMASAAADTVPTRSFTGFTEPAADLALWRLGNYGTAAAELAALA